VTLHRALVLTTVASLVLACGSDSRTATPASTSGTDASTPADASSATDASETRLDAGTMADDAGAAEDAATADASPRDAGAADAASAPTDAGPAAGTPGCGQPATPGLRGVDTMVGGRLRHYQVMVPATYDAARPTRVVFMFHGLGGDGDQIRSYLAPEAAAQGQALFVYPDGRVIPSAGRTAWEEADLLFFDAMLAEVSAAYCVDRDRVFAAGHSYGAYMTNEVGCQRAGVVRAIAAVSGGTLGTRCVGTTAAWLAHGTNDGTVPQSEGVRARDHWRTTNGCASTTTPVAPEGCVRYEGCAADAPVTWCSFTGGHFPLPAYTLDAIWGFFSAY
jgi:polyhydroxybutyrate depolymerase